ncbi:MAG: formate dehydrogenase subunit gamma [Rhodospirillaceae bacterium]|nr:formate dehydrogenase subunit gamma [Rhodospirillaceae bacterium]
MKTVLTALFRALALAAVLALAGTLSASAQTAPAAGEKELLEYLKSCPPGKPCQGRVSIPDRKSGTLVQDQGRMWQERMEGPVKRWGGWFLIAVVVLLALFYFVRGRVRVDGGLSGRKIKRFSGFERFTHWTTATSFILLGLTGLNIRFGRSLLLPLIGDDAFASLASLGKTIHNFTSFAFILGLVLMLVLWVWHNFPAKGDGAWIKAGGGILKRGAHPPAGKFNFGQKLIFWAVILVGGAIAVTGLLMMFPFYFTTLDGMQVATFLHSVLAILLIGVILAHIYIGTLGMEGAFEAMGTGQVDANWAKEHHSLWFAKTEGKKGAAAE